MSKSNTKAAEGEAKLADEAKLSPEEQAAADRAADLARAAEQAEQEAQDAGKREADTRLPDNTVVRGKPLDLPAGPVEVVAVERGYYGDRIVEPGTRFTIASAEDWGGWMRLADAKQAE